MNENENKKKSLLERFAEWDDRNLERAEKRRENSPIRQGLHTAWQAVVFTVFGFFMGGGR